MPLLIGTALPSLEGASEWINGDCETASSMNAPLLVQFWSISCPACKNGMPRVMNLLSTYRNHDLGLLSIHMPRGPWDQDVDKIKAAIGEFGLTGPCAIDNDHTLGRAFQTARLWPSYFFFDAQARLRSRAAGELGLKMAENSLKRILGASEKELSPQQGIAVIDTH